VTSEHRVDGVEEAGLAASHGPHQQHPGRGHGADVRLVALDLLHQILFLPAGRGGKRYLLLSYYKAAPLAVKTVNGVDILILSLQL